MSKPKRYHLEMQKADDGDWVLYEDYARLKAEVERLTKELENTDCMFAMASAFARAWNAAKEGKSQP
jgi:hypothetical protein